MSRRIRVSRCLALALGITLAAPAAMAGGNGIDLGGSVAGSYFYNTNRPDSGTNNEPGGFLGGSAPGIAGQAFHPSHNEFQIDQAVIDLSRARTDENKVGFRVRTALGELGDIQGTGGGNGNGIWLADAYIDYGCNCGIDIGMQLGKFQTHIGYETAFADENAQITRGLTWGIQPVDQLGLRLSSNIAGIDIMVGAVNGVSANQPDTDSKPDLVFSVGLSNDMMAVSFNGQVDFEDENDAGGSAAPDSEGLILDGIVSIMPSDSLNAWLNVTYRQVDDAVFGPATEDLDQIGINVGARLALNDKLGVSPRFEYLDYDIDNGPSAEFFALTGTLDYMLVENLTAKLEVKWDHSADFDAYDGGSEDNRVLVGTQVIYTF